jgi:hypothetical protein
LLPDVIGQLLPAWWRENVLIYLPGAASDAISIGHLDATPYVLELEPAIVVVLAWLVGFLALSYVALVRRDA